MKTLSQFKRELKNGTIKTLTLLKGGKEIYHNIPREVSKIQTNGLYLLNNGKNSWLEFPKAKLFEFVGDKIRIYLPGFRELNEEEKEVLNEWEKIANTEKVKKEFEYDLLTDTNFYFMRKKEFFQDKGFYYLTGYKKEKGLIYIPYKNVVYDDSIKGELLFEYKVN